MLLSNSFPLKRFDYTARGWRWYVSLHCKHIVSRLLLICTQKEMAHVQARCGYYCCGCTVVVNGESMNEWSPLWVDKLNDNFLLKQWLKAEELPHCSDVVQTADQHGGSFTNTEPKVLWFGAVGYFRSSYFIRLRHSRKVTLKHQACQGSIVFLPHYVTVCSRYNHTAPIISLILKKLDHILWREWFLGFLLMSSGCCAWTLCDLQSFITDSKG